MKIITTGSKLVTGAMSSKTTQSFVNAAAVNVRNAGTPVLSSTSIAKQPITTITTTTTTTTTTVVQPQKSNSINQINTSYLSSMNSSNINPTAAQKAAALLQSTSASKKSKKEDKTKSGLLVDNIDWIGDSWKQTQDTVQVNLSNLYKKPESSLKNFRPQLLETGSIPFESTTSITNNKTTPVIAPVPSEQASASEANTATTTQVVATASLQSVAHAPVAPEEEAFKFDNKPFIAPEEAPIPGYDGGRVQNKAMDIPFTIDQNISTNNARPEYKIFGAERADTAPQLPAEFLASLKEKSGVSGVVTDKMPVSTQEANIDDFSALKAIVKNQDAEFEKAERAKTEAKAKADQEKAAKKQAKLEAAEKAKTEKEAKKLAKKAESEKRKQEKSAQAKLLTQQKKLAKSLNEAHAKPSEANEGLSLSGLFGKDVDVISIKDSTTNIDNKSAATTQSDNSAMTPNQNLVRMEQETNGSKQDKSYSEEPYKSPFFPPILPISISLAASTVAGSDDREQDIATSSDTGLAGGFTSNDVTTNPKPATIKPVTTHVFATGATLSIAPTKKAETAVLEEAKGKVGGTVTKHFATKVVKNDTVTTNVVEGDSVTTIVATTKKTAKPFTSKPMPVTESKGLNLKPKWLLLAILGVTAVAALAIVGVVLLATVPPLGAAVLAATGGATIYFATTIPAIVAAAAVTDVALGAVAIYNNEKEAKQQPKVGGPDFVVLKPTEKPQEKTVQVATM
jgi:hypothetical protein